MSKTIIIDKILMNYIDFEKREIAFSNDFVDLSNTNMLEYYHKKIEKTLCNNNLTPIVNINTEVLDDLILCANEKYMIDKAKDITNQLTYLGKHLDDIPNTNVMFVKFRVDDIPFLGIIKLNFKELPKMMKKEVENKRAILLTQKQQFPSSPSKADEAIFINLKENQVYLIEKKFSIDGKKGFYLNEHWLKGEKKLNDKQKMNYLIKTLKKVNGLYGVYEDDMLVVLKDLIVNADNFNIFNVVEKIFESNQDAKEEAKMILNDLNINEEENINCYSDISLSKIVTSEDIEIRLDNHYLLNKDMIEIQENYDKTFNIILHNVNGYVIK